MTECCYHDLSMDTFCPSHCRWERSLIVMRCTPNLPSHGIEGLIILLMSLFVYIVFQDLNDAQKPHDVLEALHLKPESLENRLVHEIGTEVRHDNEAIGLGSFETILAEL